MRRILFVVLSLLASVSAQGEPLHQILFGSCNKHDVPQPIWKAILANKPDLWIWLGDNIYGDTIDMDLLAAKYRAQKAQPDYAALAQSARVIGTWDDHDYGRDDAGKEFPMRRESQQVFLDFVDEPLASPRRKQEGVYAAYSFGKRPQMVKVILLDTRYHRDFPGPETDVLGEEQWTWLERQLTASPAAIHVIGSSIQVVAEEYNGEKWSDFPKARRRLFDLIAKTKSSGVIFISGDRHLAEISRLDDSPAGYPVFDLTSSGLSHPFMRDGKEPNRHRVGTNFTKHNFGRIGIDWQSDPVEIILEIRDEQNDAVRSQKIRLSDLQTR